jgi:phosphoenolpyruvate synthase/pyruvate phosphate dikinase
MDATGLREKINHVLSKINIEDTKQLTAKAAEIRELVIETKMQSWSYAV